MSKLRIVIAQQNFWVGNIDYNLEKMLTAIEKAKQDHHADLVLFPELSLTGYPPEDLLLREDFHVAIQQGLRYLCSKISGIDVIVGYPEKSGDLLYNAATLIRDGKHAAHYRKQLLPNYGVFDEKRYFTPGEDNCIFICKGIPIGLTICEDLWFSEPAQRAKAAGAKLIVSLNASPFDIYKLRDREKILMERVKENHLPIVYAHCIGGQDEIVFDGRSIAMDETGKIKHLAPVFTESLIPVDIEYAQEQAKIVSEYINPLLTREARAYKALVQGVRDYVHKNHFKKVILGLSGGIDSALTLAVAVDALGKENVYTVILPSRFTAEYSISDAKLLAQNMGVKCDVISIEPQFQLLLTELKPYFANKPWNNTEENLQSRCRAIVLMALANKFDYLLLNTSNKSETAMGYTTLYGDMAGGFAVLKDVYKTLVYELVAYRNQIEPIIPTRMITRPPSAELHENQTDQETLPPYDVLDKILELYIEHAAGIAEIVRQGFDRALVANIIRRVDQNEYKRRQAPPGVKITTRAFGRDRRYPITSGFVHK